MERCKSWSPKRKACENYPEIPTKKLKKLVPLKQNAYAENPPLKESVAGVLEVRLTHEDDVQEEVRE